MFNYSHASKHIKSIGKYEGQAPPYYKTLQRYFSLTSKPKSQQEVIDKFLGERNYKIKERVEVRKQLGREFMVDWFEYREKFMRDTKKEKTMVDFLNGVFVLDYIHDIEVRIRYKELESTISKFKEIEPDIYMYDATRAVKFVLPISGRCLEYPKGIGCEEVVREDKVIKIRYKNGYEEVLYDGIRFNPNFIDGFLRLEKGYYRFSAGGGAYFRAHVLTTALVFGVDILKFTLGRNSLLTVDHIDGDEGNNLISNLRLVTRKDNRMLANDITLAVWDFFDLPVKGLKKVRSFTGEECQVQLAREGEWSEYLC